MSELEGLCLVGTWFGLSQFSVVSRGHQERLLSALTLPLGKDLDGSFLCPGRRPGRGKVGSCIFDRRPEPITSRNWLT